MTSIAIDGVSGEVFIGTDQNIVSYRVRRRMAVRKPRARYPCSRIRCGNLPGPVAITGLTASDVRIADIAATLVYRNRCPMGPGRLATRRTSADSASVLRVYLVLASGPERHVTVTPQMVVVSAEERGTSHVISEAPRRSGTSALQTTRAVVLSHHQYSDKEFRDAGVHGALWPALTVHGPRRVEGQVDGGAPNAFRRNWWHRKAQARTADGPGHVIVGRSRGFEETDTGPAAAVRTGSVQPHPARGDGGPVPVRFH